MQVAQYFSTGSLPPEQWRHYALGEAAYTHFTSPIRRYPDVVVHRLLAAALAGRGSIQAGSSESGQSAAGQPEAAGAQQRRPPPTQLQRQRQQWQRPQPSQGAAVELPSEPQQQQPPQRQPPGETVQQHSWERKPEGQASAVRRRQRRQHLQPTSAPAASLAAAIDPDGCALPPAHFAA